MTRNCIIPKHIKLKSCRRITVQIRPLSEWDQNSILVKVENLEEAVLDCNVLRSRILKEFIWKFYLLVQSSFEYRVPDSDLSFKHSLRIVTVRHKIESLIGIVNIHIDRVNIHVHRVSRPNKDPCHFITNIQYWDRKLLEIYKVEKWSYSGTNIAIGRLDVEARDLKVGLNHTDAYYGRVLKSCKGAWRVGQGGEGKVTHVLGNVECRSNVRKSQALCESNIGPVWKFSVVLWISWDRKFSEIQNFQWVWIDEINSLLFNKNGNVSIGARVQINNFNKGSIDWFVWILSIA